MQRCSLALVFVVALALGGVACSNADDEPDGGSATTTTAAPVTTTTSAVTPSGPPQTPDAAADGLFGAWRGGDREDASRYAKPGAISELFAHPDTGDVSYADQGCAPQGGQFVCSWTYPGGALQMTVESWPGGGYVVDDVTYIAD
ncbi:MAG TPA: hypothetical protein VMZ22_05820 [Acidimicrobiales bacterium]|nr:hypothetical protein [Acidimicrobiales bacterium]